jgi:hypothetical protein
MPQIGRHLVPRQRVLIMGWAQSQARNAVLMHARAPSVRGEPACCGRVQLGIQMMRYMKVNTTSLYPP